MLLMPDTTLKVIRYAHVKHGVHLVGKDIDVVATLLHASIVTPAIKEISYSEIATSAYGLLAMTMGTRAPRYKAHSQQ